MINNLIILVIVTISYAGYNLFIKLASSQNLNNSNSIAATLSLQLFALFVTILFSFYLFSKGEKIFVLPSKSYLYAIFAGISIGLAEIGYFYLFNESNPKGASNANTVIPVILGGTILITMIFSFISLSESFNYKRIFGTFFIIFGIYLVLQNNNN